MRKTLGVFALFGAGCLLAGCGGDDGAMGMRVRTEEMEFLPSSISVAAGSQRFTVDNTGALRHTFSLNALGEEVTVAPGQVKELVVDLEPGTYRYVCRVLDHEGLGMTGVLKVRDRQ